MKNIRKMFLIMWSLLTFIGCDLSIPNNPNQTGYAHKLEQAEPLDDQALISLGMRIPRFQERGDKIPPQPGALVDGVVITESRGDLRWTAFTLVLVRHKNTFKVLTQKRKGGPFGHIETAGGHLVVGNNWRQGAILELSQEAGIDVSPRYLKYLQGGRVRANGQKLVGNVNFFVVFNSVPMTKEDSDEIDKDYGHQWLDLKKAFLDISLEQQNLGKASGKFYGYFRSHLIHFCTEVITCAELPDA